MADENGRDERDDGTAAETAANAAAPGNLEEELRKKTEEAAANFDRYVRAVADAENFKKRLQRDKAEAIRYANENLLRDLLQVVDSLDLALAHAGQGAANASLAEGVGLTRRVFRDVMERYGVKELPDAAGQPFDPNHHEANGLESSAEIPANSVIRVLSKGYTYHDRLLRPARVVVAAGPPAPVQ